MKIRLEHLKPHQKEILKLFYSHVATYNVLTGGAGTFKTSTAILGWLQHCMLHPGQLIYVLGVDYTTIEDVWIAEFKRQVDAKDYVMSGGKGDRVIYLPKYDSTFKFKQWSRPTVEKALASIATGDTISGYHLLQPDMLEDKKRLFMGRFDQRVRLFSDRVDDPRHKRILDQNAPPPGHWTEEFFIDKKSKNYVGGLYENAVKIISIRTTATTSKYSQLQIDTQKLLMPPHIYARFVEGYSVKAEGQIYTTSYFHGAIRPDELEHYSIGFDPGEGEHPWALIFVGKLKSSETWVVFDEIKNTDDNLDAIIGMVKTKMEYWGRNNLKFMVYDWSGHVYKKHFSSRINAALGHVFPASNRNKYFSVNSGIEMLRYNFITKRLLICENLPLIQRDMLGYIYSDNGYSPDKKKYDPHLLDALRYVWIRVARVYQLDRIDYGK